MSKTKYQLMQNNSTDHEFTSGLLMGTVVGIASYYLFGTKHGQQVRDQLVMEFEKIKAELPPELINNSDGKLLQRETLPDKVESVLTKNTTESAGLFSRFKRIFQEESQSVAGNFVKTENRERRYFKRKVKK